MHKNSKLAIFGLMIAAGIFVLDITMPLGGVVATLYVLLVLLSLLATDSIFTVWATTIATILVLVGTWYGDGFDGALLNRGFALIIMWLTAILSIQRQSVEKELRDVNLNLELKVLARTAASENNSIRLQRQIKALEDISKNKKAEGFQTLDNVISNLRELTEEDNSIDVEFDDDNG